ncbi:MAG: inositol monophosphatase family protein, partial [candidate division Zixibacteria bacterium]|nr:inositol monophosphatase family protein [candidate division Zixibacteria bacterium]
FTIDLALGAGKILKRGFNRNFKVEYKGRIDPVTEYDLKSEQYIISRIAKKYPRHSILSEEGSGNGEQAEFRWVIDPLDGTVDFAHGFPVYCVSIGLEHEGEMIAGAVYDPERDELFYAARHQGAFLNKKRIHVSKEKVLERALLATGFGYNVATARKNNLGLFARMVKKAQAVRRLGSAALDLCWLASGRIDGFWELYLHPWDTAAAFVIVEEAGGEITRLDGRPYSIFAIDILAANPKLRRVIQKVLTGNK